jgi:dipeptidyl aminopeptidase/acylaminoacyl peptidase
VAILAGLQGKGSDGNPSGRRIFDYPDPSKFLSFLPSRSEPDVTNDGTWVVYTTQAPGHTSAIYAVDAKTSAQIQVESGLQGVYYPKWSPNGRHLAYLAQDGSFDAGFRLRIWDRETKRLKRVQSFVGVNTSEGYLMNPQWTTDSRWVTFGARVNPADHNGTEAVTPSKDGVVLLRSTSTRFAPAGAPPVGPEQEKRGFFREAVRNQVVAVDPVSLQTIVLARGGYLWDSSLSPDGKLLFVARRQRVAEGEEHEGFLSLFLVNVPDKAKRGGTVACEAASPDVLCGPDGKLITAFATDVPLALGSRVCWSPNGKYLGYSTSGSAATGDFFVVDVSTRQTRNLTENSIPPFESSLKITRAARDFGFSTKLAPRQQFKWSPDSSEALVDVRELYGKEASIWAVKITDGSARQIPTPGLAIRSMLGVRGGNPAEMLVAGRESADSSLGLFLVNAQTGAFRPIHESLTAEVTVSAELGTWNAIGCSGQCLLVKKESYSQPADLWLYRFDSNKMARLTTLNPELTDVIVPRSRVLRNADGTKIVGLLTLPEHRPADKYPLIVEIYGGSTRTEESLEYAGGYLKSLVNTRRVLGRGYALLQVSSWIEGLGTACQQIGASVEAAVDAALATGRIDADRMGIYGYSFGGYSVNCSITRPNRFRAAVSAGGLSDMTSLYLGKAALGTGQARIGGSLWEFPDRYVSQSPIYRLDKVTCPLLLVHAEDDLTAPFPQSEEMYYGLEHLGKEVMLVRFPTKGYRHAMPTLEPSYWPRILDWFDFYLHPQPTNSAAAQHPPK